jgi:hypothetical protein
MKITPTLLAAITTSMAGMGEHLQAAGLVAFGVALIFGFYLWLVACGSLLGSGRKAASAESRSNVC